MRNIYYFYTTKYRKKWNILPIKYSFFRNKNSILKNI